MYQILVLLEIEQLQQRMNPKPQLTNYRNASFLGHLTRSMREDNGILITDDSYILMANWKQNLIHGPYIYLFENNCILGHCFEGTLDTFNLIVTPAVKIFANYSNNLIHGKCIIEDSKGIRLFTFEKGNKVGAGTQIAFSKLKDAVWREFGEEYVDVPQYLERYLERPEVKSSTGLRVVRISQNYNYYGSVNEAGECEGLGFIMNVETCEVYSCGQYKGGNLNGLGRTYQGSSVILDGIFQGGEFKGSGVSYDTLKNEYTVGNKQNSKVLFGDPTREIRQARKEFHLRSLSFVNQLVLVSSILKVNISDITGQNLRLKENSMLKVNVHPPHSDYLDSKDQEDIHDKFSNVKSTHNLVSLKPAQRFELDRQAKSISSMSKKSLFDNNFSNETKELVRDLESQSKQRIDLHSIYRKAGLTNPKKK